MTPPLPPHSLEETSPVRAHNVWAPPRAPLRAGRPPLWRGVVPIAAVLAETSVLLALVGICAGGVFAGGEPEPPVALGVRVLPAIAAIVVYAVWARLRRHRFGFVLATCAALALAGAAYPDPEIGPLLTALLAIPVGFILAAFAMPVHQLTKDLDDRLPHPWRELQIGATLPVFGSLACAVRWGAIVGAPTIAVGVAILLRSLRFDLPALGRSGERVGALVRGLLALVMLLLAIGLLVVGSGISFGMVPLP